MAIPVNIEDLLHKRKIESTRIEFKTRMEYQIKFIAPFVLSLMILITLAEDTSS